MISDSSKLLAHVAKIFGMIAVIAAILLIVFFAGGCGKKGMPEPHDSSKSFTWKEVSAKPAGSCIAFIGSFEGSYKNYDGIRLEVSPVNGPDDCPGCPFVPQEVHELSRAETGFNPQDGSIAFSYCPSKAKAYRWRLAGISIFNRLPHAEMTDKMLIMNPETSDRRIQP